MEAPVLGAGPAGAAAGEGAAGARGRPAGAGAVFGGQPAAALAAATPELGSVVSLLACPVRTPGCVAADEVLGELKAYKLGKRKRSYNQVCVELQHAGDPARVLPLVHAQERPGGGLPAPAGPAPALQYELRLASGASLRAALYVVYATPLPAEEAVLSQAPPAALPRDGDAAGGEAQHAWLSVSRAHCCRGCDADLPLLAGIQRLSRARRTPTAAATPAGAAARAPRRASAGAAASLAADDGAAGADEAARDGRIKDARHLYVSLDEPSAHVAPGPGGTRRFRLLLAVWAHAPGGDLASPPGPLLGSALSRPICVVANNDVPGGAAALSLRVQLRADWEGWSGQTVPRLPAPASSQLHAAMCSPPARRAPLQVLPVNAPVSRQAMLQAAADAAAARSGDGTAAAAAQALSAAAAVASAFAPPTRADAPRTTSDDAAAVAPLPALAELAPLDDTFQLICSTALAPLPPLEAAPRAPQSGSGAGGTASVFAPPAELGADALLSLGSAAAADAAAEALVASAAVGAAVDAMEESPRAPVASAEGAQAAAGSGGSDSAREGAPLHGCEDAMDCDALPRSARTVSAPRATAPRRSRRSSAASFGASGGSRSAGGGAAAHKTTPTAAQGAEALTALLANSRANGLPPTRLLFQSGGAGDADDDDYDNATAGGSRAAAAVYVRKDHSLRTLCQRFFGLYARSAEPVIIADAAAQLGVKARRIYDVMNVLETLGLVSRQFKGTYAFCGCDSLQAMLHRFAAAPADTHVVDAGATPPAQGGAAVVALAALTALHCAAGGSAGGKPASSGMQPGSGDAAAFAAIQAAARAANAAAAAQPGGDSTLAGLTQRFVRAFLAAPSDTLAWDDCLERLGATDRSSRRLYDVANVLCAIRLIEKAGCATYRWLGAASVAASMAELSGAAAPAPDAAAPAAATEAAPSCAPVVPKRARAPRSRPATATKRPRCAGDGDAAATAAPLASDATPADDVGGRAALMDGADATADAGGEGVAAPAVLAASLARLARAAACPGGIVGATPTTVLGAHDALLSPDAATPQTGCDAVAFFGALLEHAPDAAELLAA